MTRAEYVARWRRNNPLKHNAMKERWRLAASVRPAPKDKRERKHRAIYAHAKRWGIPLDVAARDLLMGRAA